MARAAADRVAEHMSLVARRVVVCAPGSLPRTSSGKIRRSEALRRHLAGELTPPRRVGRLAVLAAMFKGLRALKAGRG
jgi:acyl-coenzyme A synthetase/AMP-(fatty) acid ligase